MLSHVLHRRLLGAVLPLVVAVCFAPSAAVADQTISSSGPIEALTIGEDLACQVSYIQGGTFEFFPPNTSPGDCGTFVSVDGTLYEPFFELHDGTATKFDTAPPLTPVSETRAGTGTSTDPYTLITNVAAGDTGVTLEQRTTYVTGESSFRIEITARNSGSNARNIGIYFAGDCYASGSDIGFGFVRPEIKSVGCSQAADNNPQGRTIQLLPLSPGSSGVEDRYLSVWNRIAALEAFDGSCRCAESVDNGVGLKWNTVVPGNVTRSFSLQVAFTEAQQAAPAADSDGDSLPDSWETGQGAVADAENLAPLGADPRRPDIFVQADWMEGCRPPQGWEQPVVDMFGSKGIALHVDTGQSPSWKGPSRAGAVPYQATLDLNNWAQVDAAKDAYFLPSGRRRAFHYVLFADGAVIGSTGLLGLSRGIPDSDFVVANCHAQPSIGGPVVRGDADYFAHELGHNLGLRHGGVDDRRYKTPYFSSMNYGWLYWSAAQDSRFVPYSDQVLPSIDENNIDEHAGIATPAEYFCPGDELTGKPSKHFLGPVRLTDGDFDCDGVYGERKVRANLDGSGETPPTFDILAGSNDWAAITYRAGGIVGAATLPARQDTPPVPDLTIGELQQSVSIATTAAAADAKRLRVLTKVQLVKKPKRKKAKSTLKVRVVTLTGAPVRKATVRIKGGTLARGRKSRRTDASGRVTLKLSLRSVKQLQVIADRAGYRRATLLIPVTR